MAQAPLSLPRLPPSMGRELQVYWQMLCEAIESNEAIQQATLDALDEIINDDGGLQTQVSINSSFPVPTMTLTATDAGASATITVAAHTRFYAGDEQVSVSGGSITGLSYSTTYAVYYDDTTRNEPAPTFYATTDLETGQSNYAEGRHYVGTVTTPAALGGPTTGGAPPPASGYNAGTGSVVIT